MATARLADLQLTSSFSNRTSTEPLPLTAALGPVLQHNRRTRNQGIAAAVLSTLDLHDYNKYPYICRCCSCYFITTLQYPISLKSALPFFKRTGHWTLFHSVESCLHPHLHFRQYPFNIILNLGLKSGLIPDGFPLQYCIHYFVLRRACQCHWRLILIV
jgi:hypothetical protein